jgi:hypothetical protein
MLTSRCFTRDWIARQMHDTGARGATNLEKCILALELVSRLSAAGLDFVFKGGTCLVLHLQPIRRLSAILILGLVGSDRRADLRINEVFRPKLARPAVGPYRADY